MILFFSLHTDHPGDIGSPPRNEVSYPNYCRVAMRRTAKGWPVREYEGQAILEFPMGGGPLFAVNGHATHFGVSLEDGLLLHAGTIEPGITVGSRVIPQLVLCPLDEFVKAIMTGRCKEVGGIENPLADGGAWTGPEGMPQCEPVPLASVVDDLVSALCDPDKANGETLDGLMALTGTPLANERPPQWTPSSTYPTMSTGPSLCEQLQKRETRPDGFSQSRIEQIKAAMLATGKRQ